jgi:hypothetical protein
VAPTGGDFGYGLENKGALVSIGVRKSERCAAAEGTVVVDNVKIELARPPFFARLSPSKLFNPLQVRQERCGPHGCPHPCDRIDEIWLIGFSKRGGFDERGGADETAAPAIQVV